LAEDKPRIWLDKTVDDFDGDFSYCWPLTMMF
jgi:hypothetical protein